jgi:hypothetical protein
MGTQSSGVGWPAVAAVIHAPKARLGSIGLRQSKALSSVSCRCVRRAEGLRKAQVTFALCPGGTDSRRQWVRGEQLST